MFFWDEVRFTYTWSFLCQQPSYFCQTCSEMCDIHAKSTFVSLQRFTSLCITHPMMSFIFFFVFCQNPFSQPCKKNTNCQTKLKKNLRRRFVSPVWLTGHMSARGSPLRGLLKLVSVSLRPGEIEKKGRREHLSRWCALMLARDQIRILFLTLVKTEAWIYAVKIYMQMLICSLPLAGYLEQIVSP